MRLFLLNYSQELKNLSVNEYYTIGDLQEACLIKYSLRDEEIDYIYFYTDNKIIILGTEELKYTSTISDMITKYNIFQYRLYIKKNFTLSLSPPVYRLSYNDTINETIRRNIDLKFKSYLQERNGRIISTIRNRENEEKINYSNNTNNSLFLDYEDSDDDYEDNNDRKNQNETYTRIPILDESEPSSDSDDNIEENKINYTNIHQNNNINSRIHLSQTSSNNHTERTIQNINTSIQNINNLRRRLNLYTQQNNNIERPSYQQNIEERKIILNNRIREIELRYGFNMGDNGGQELRNDGINTISGLINLMNRTIGLISINDLLNEFNSSLNNTFSNISIPLNNSLNTYNQNILNQIDQDDENEDHLLIDTPEDVKIVMSETEFNEMKNEPYIDYITRTRPESIIIIDNEEKRIHIEDIDMCSICSDDFILSSTIINLPKCNHIFHKPCIGRWLTDFKNKCPLCNTSVSDNPIHI